MTLYRRRKPLTEQQHREVATLTIEAERALSRLEDAINDTEPWTRTKQDKVDERERNYRRFAKESVRDERQAQAALWKLIERFGYVKSQLRFALENEIANDREGTCMREAAETYYPGAR